MQKQKQMATTTTLHLQMQFDIRLATSSLFRPLNHHRHLHISQRAVAAHRSSSRSTTPFRLFAFSTDTSEPFVEKVRDKPPICTADELHHVSVPNCDWRLALWRYHPPPQAPTRNHLLLLLSGVGTNAIGYDLSPRSSFARYMSGQGFDIWILEVRGFGLSVRGSNLKEVEQSAVEN